jgi:undecaprenyl-diphosphatase
VTLLAAALLGIVQGLTEFLPVSSTAHLLLIGRAISFEDPGGVFTVMIQAGSILAIVWLYRVRLLGLLAGLRSQLAARRFAAALIVATVPALFAGALFADYIKRVVYHTPMVVAIAFIGGGIVMLIFERALKVPVVSRAEDTPLPRALVVGLCQMTALVPGVSRSGATIVGGMAAGLSRTAAAEFSFFLAIPTMTAAFGHDLLQVRDQLSTVRGLEIAIGLTTAFISSLVVIKPFLAVVGRTGFAPFAWYRIALGVVLLAGIAAGWVQG